MGKELLRNRRGEEMVEAAVVVPLLILILLSMLLVLLYFYRAEQKQSAAHIALTEASISDNRIFAVQKREYETGAGLRGAVKIRMEQKRIRRCYVLNPADGVWMGDLFHEKDE
ncbi:hypothetical protein BHK98_01110 [Hornefia porci]|uniref:TadE-like domain-containing protein n=1 Tax=Hornefia porci TaxID=2652292 RepID=A0A1Q9JF39_9FIRM|nr:hypothetical protein [Hornefia porci]OLR54803.1 hypothetical protein BHK98_01110 [Hornefia porci]